NDSRMLAFEQLDVAIGLIEIAPCDREHVGDRNRQGQAVPAFGIVGRAILEDVHELETLAECGREGEELGLSLRLEEVREKLADDSGDDVAILLEIFERPNVVAAQRPLAHSARRSNDMLDHELAL